MLRHACPGDNKRNGNIIILANRGVVSKASILLEEEQPRKQITLGRQTASFFAHAVFALLAWSALMAAGYIFNPRNVPQTAILGASVLVPLILGVLVNRSRQSEMAASVWLLGIMWFVVVALWVVDMPTGPNECFQCTMGEKLTRTFLSMPTTSGLIDDDGPFLGTWPAAALVGYAIGARLAMRSREEKTPR